MPKPTLIASSSEVASAACQVLTFDLGAEHYAIALDDVQEIQSYTVPTKLPSAPAHTLGVINLRGAVIPLVDMRILTGCAKGDITATTAVIIVKAEERMVGLVVDSVCEVQELSVGQLKAPPCRAYGSNVTILGLAHVHDQMIIVLNARPYLDLAASQVESAESGIIREFA